MTLELEHNPTHTLFSGYPETIFPFCERILGAEFDKKNSFTMGIEYDSELVGGIIWDQYRPGHMIQINLATLTPHWCTRKILREIFDYPFNHLGVMRLQAITWRSNKALRSLVERLGFRFEGIAYLGTEHNGQVTDAACYSILSRQCEKMGWIKLNGQAKCAKAA